MFENLTASLTVKLGEKINIGGIKSFRTLVHRIVPLNDNRRQKNCFFQIFSVKTQKPPTVCLKVHIFVRTQCEKILLEKLYMYYIKTMLYILIFKYTIILLEKKCNNIGRKSVEKCKVEETTLWLLKTIIIT